MWATGTAAGPSMRQTLSGSQPPALRLLSGVYAGVDQKHSIHTLSETFIRLRAHKLRLFRSEVIICTLRQRTRYKKNLSLSYIENTLEAKGRAILDTLNVNVIQLFTDSSQAD